jgi:hypothetical protein
METKEMSLATIAPKAHRATTPQFGVNLPQETFSTSEIARYKL